MIYACRLCRSWPLLPDEHLHVQRGAAHRLQRRQPRARHAARAVRATCHRTTHLSHLAAEICARLRAFARELGVVGQVDLGEVVARGVGKRVGRREVSVVWYMGVGSVDRCGVIVTMIIIMIILIAITMIIISSSSITIIMIIIISSIILLA